MAVAAFAPAPQEATPIEIEPDQPAAIAAPIEPEPKKLAAIEAPVREPQKPGETASIEEEPKAFPAPLRPRLIASRPDPVGNVAVIMAEILEPGRGKVEIEDVFAAYVEACKRTGKGPSSTLQDILAEALNDIFTKYNVPTIRHD